MSAHQRTVNALVIGDNHEDFLNKTLLNYQGDFTPYPLQIAAPYSKEVTIKSYGSVVIHVKNILDIKNLLQTQTIQYNHADVVIILYSRNDPKSYEHIHTEWYPQIKQCHLGIPYIIGAGLPESEENSDIIDSAQGIDLAKTIGATGYCEFSLSTLDGLKAMFDMAIRQALSEQAAPPRRNRFFCCLSAPREEPDVETNTLDSQKDEQRCTM